MRIRQVSVFLENRQGQVFPVLERLAAEGINLRAVALAERAVRHPAHDRRRPDATADIVRDMGITVMIVPVFGVHVPDRPERSPNCWRCSRTRRERPLHVHRELRRQEAQLMLRLQPEDEAEAILKAAGY